ncbi:putative RpiR family transcriptional regulator [Tetragenococcus halophilus subsp. halophilus]|uniref:RpiR family transcriptional regulator n=2 Tax=Tetragenococcus halophilus TaxID=51669 RepID=A0AAN1SI71_TETHN|nr:MurR/RpiR family transcriptional regulator [Tetragenococcus halophilus]MCO7026033.1 MurR/RpiR family transcriptional regulator [Tetragenococcus halophilus]NWN99773.1 MurR/RpiR family transcriptional regulator [Tetragenococcus halophilus]QGP77202.1 SIS domain-containing protein [Tetragenococcus halophilus]BAK95362.1 putative RpiR family transcriptional regulator [Tetragenococcus halophilus NBRC 12172]GBD71728.1 putative RpiR family transcriptional regulator [Tetragenococcus halophilus subsp.
MLIQEKLSHQANMTEIEKVIADYFLEKPDNLRQNSTRKLGEILFVAPSTITRFCKRLGFTGYNDFKEDYLKEYQYLQSHFKDVNPNRPFEMSDGIWTMANKISQLYTETILDTLSLQNFQILEKAVHLLKNSNKIYVYSTGNHINLANNFKNKMLTVGKSVEVIYRFDLAFYNIDYAKKNDCFILISYSGETNDMLRVLEELKRRELTVLALTSFGDNTLSKSASVVLNISTREKLINNLGNFSSDLSVMYLLDILYAGYFSGDYQKHLAQKNKIAKGYQQFRSSDNPLLKD